MSANLLEKTTPGPWEVWEGHAEVVAGPVSINTPGELAGYRGTVCECSADNGEDEEEGEEIALANAQLIAVAPDHALWGAAATLDVVTYRAGNVFILRGIGASDRFPAPLDPFGCPLLTPELREALRKAVGL